MDLKAISHQMELCARKAGQFILAEMDQVKAEHIFAKEEFSLVSYVDQRAEEILVKELETIIPTARFITEEETVTQSNETDWTWIIDPLDGTTNFIHKIPAFSVSIGLVHKQIPVAGVIYHIIADEMFTAWSGGGAYLNGRHITTSNTNKISDAVIATGFPYKRTDVKSLVRILETMITEARGIRRFGSAAIDLAFTACGRFDAYYEGSINPWDVAAGIIIAREAGAKVTGIDGEDEPLYLGHILVSNKILHPIVLQLIK